MLVKNGGIFSGECFAGKREIGIGSAVMFRNESAVYMGRFKTPGRKLRARGFWTVRISGGSFTNQKILRIRSCSWQPIRSYPR